MINCELCPDETFLPNGWYKKHNLYDNNWHIEMTDKLNLYLLSEFLNWASKNWLTCLSNWYTSYMSTLKSVQKLYKDENGWVWTIDFYYSSFYNI